jgi:dTMP kinase
MTKGRYICLEGGDSVGKSTQAELLNDWLLTKGIEPILAPQPGATKFGSLLRQMVKHETDLQGLETEAMVFVLDHMSFVENVLLDALGRGAWVVSDRNDHISGMVYQVLNGVDPDRLDSFYSMVPTPKIDVVFLMHAPVSVLKTRADERGDTRWDRYESNSAFLERVYHRYNTLIDDHSDRLCKITNSCVSIDASAKIGNILDEIKSHLSVWL